MTYSEWLHSQCRELGIANHEYMDSREMEHMLCMVKWEKEVGLNLTPLWNPDGTQKNPPRTNCWGETFTLPGGTVCCQRHIDGCPPRRHLSPPLDFDQP